MAMVQPTRHEVKFRINIKKYVRTEPLNSSGAVSNPIPRPTNVPRISVDKIYEDEVPNGYMVKDVDVDVVYRIDDCYRAVLMEHREAQSLIQMLFHAHKDHPDERMRTYIPADFAAEERKTRSKLTALVMDEVLDSLIDEIQYYPRSSIVKIIKVCILSNDKVVNYLKFFEI
jgi:hypothetical protein